MSYRGSIFIGISLVEHDFNSYDFRDSIFIDCNFKGCDFIETDFEGSTFDKVNFEDSRLTGANLEGVRVYGSRFNSTDLTDVNFKEALVTALRLPEAKERLLAAHEDIWDRIVGLEDYSKYDLPKEFDGAISRFEDCTVSGCDFTNSEMLAIEALSCFSRSKNPCVVEGVRMHYPEREEGFTFPYAHFVGIPAKISAGSQA